MNWLKKAQSTNNSVLEKYGIKISSLSPNEFKKIIEKQRAQEKRDLQAAASLRNNAQPAVFYSQRDNFKFTKIENFEGSTNSDNADYIQKSKQTIEKEEKANKKFYAAQEKFEEAKKRENAILAADALSYSTSPQAVKRCEEEEAERGWLSRAFISFFFGLDRDERIEACTKDS